MIPGWGTKLLYCNRDLKQPNKYIKTQLILSKTEMFLLFFCSTATILSNKPQFVARWISCPCLPFCCALFSHPWPYFPCHPSHRKLLIYLVHVFEFPFHPLINAWVFPWSVHYSILHVSIFQDNIVMCYISHSFFIFTEYCVLKSYSAFLVRWNLKLNIWASLVAQK